MKKQLLSVLAVSFLLGGTLAWAQSGVEKKIGNQAPVDVTLGGQSAITAKNALPAGLTPGDLPNDKAVEFEAPATTPLEARVWNFDTQGNTVLEECQKVLPSTDNKLVLDMGSFNCPGFTRNGSLIELKAGAQFAYFTMKNKVSPQVGDDMGIALTLVDRWRQRDAEGKPFREGARTNSGMSFYYSVSNLKTNRLRLIGNVSLLDGDPEIDFETGLGVGLLFRTRPLIGEGTGFGLAAGVGYNLMLDEEDDRWYTFIGFSMNFNQQNGN